MECFVMNKKMTAIFYAFLAALFYALNVPCSKAILRDVSPTFMASFLYLGTGAGVGFMYLFRMRSESREQRLAKKDLPYTIAMVLLDIIAPILLMMGVKIGSAANASLLGNFEIVATSVIALLFFKEKVSKRLWGAIGLVTVASVILSFTGNGSLDFSLGSLLVIGATVCWGFENNCTRSISEKSTYEIVTIKGFGSGIGAFLVACMLGETMPKLQTVGCIMLLGYIAYGLSIFTYIRAQKVLGAAKTSAYYAVAPFIGVILCDVFLHETFSVSFVIALLLMLLGTCLIVYDTLLHSHRHAHTHAITHTHDGTTHTHVVEHSHDHVHVLNDKKHGHTHPLAELEQQIGHSSCNK